VFKTFTTSGYTKPINFDSDKLQQLPRTFCYPLPYTSSDKLLAGRSRDPIPIGTRFSAPVQTGPRAQPGSCTMGSGSFPGIKSGRDVTLTPHPLLVPWSRKSTANSYTSTPPMDRAPCTEPQCLYSRAIPLLPLWAVWSVQSLSACTVYLYL